MVAEEHVLIGLLKSPQIYTVLFLWFPVSLRARFLKKIQDCIFESKKKTKMCFFTKKINPRSFGSWHIKGTEISTSRVVSLVPLTHHDPRDLGLICLVKKCKIHLRIPSDLRIQSWIFSKKHALSFDWEDNIKHTKFLTTSPNTSKLIKNTPCRVIFSTLSLVFGNGFCVWYIAWKLHPDKSGSVPKQNKTNLWIFLQRCSYTIPISSIQKLQLTPSFKSV